METFDATSNFLTLTKIGIYYLQIFVHFANMMVEITIHRYILDASQDSLDFPIVKTVLAQKKGLYRLYAMKILER